MKIGEGKAVLFLGACIKLHLRAHRHTVWECHGKHSSPYTLGCSSDAVSNSRPHCLMLVSPVNMKVCCQRNKRGRSVHGARLSLAVTHTKRPGGIECVCRSYCVIAIAQTDSVFVYTVV